jgi:hypothetical protein
MKLPQHIFALSKPEQRVVIVILLALLAGTSVMRYREKRSHVPGPVNLVEDAAATPSTTQPAREQTGPNE